MGLLQVIVATVASQILGAVWYSADFPTGKVWQKHANIRGSLGSNGQVLMLVAFVLKLVLSLVLDDRLRFLIAGGSIMGTAERALWVSTIPSICYATHAVFLGHKWPAILVDITYDAASLIIMSIILIHL